MSWFKVAFILTSIVKALPRETIGNQRMGQFYCQSASPLCDTYHRKLSGCVEIYIFLTVPVCQSVFYWIQTIIQTDSQNGCKLLNPSNCLMESKGCVAVCDYHTGTNIYFTASGYVPKMLNIQKIVTFCMQTNGHTYQLAELVSKSLSHRAVWLGPHAHFRLTFSTQWYHQWRPCWYLGNDRQPFM